jgi:HSP20 family molecular chaperone IbpA
MPTTLETFDPFDELDRMMSRNIRWLNQPEFTNTIIPQLPLVPEKHRITVNCKGFDPTSIKTEIKGNKIHVHAHEENPTETKDLKKTYTLPKNVDKSKLISFVTPDDQLVVELPLKREENLRLELLPKIIDAKDGGKMIQLNVGIPENIDPKKNSCIS